MDPNEVLKELREQCKELLSQYESSEPDIDVSDAEAEMASRFVSLDLWLTTGGALPKAWSK